MKIYVTKWWQTAGIIECEVLEYEGKYYKAQLPSGDFYWISNRDAFDNLKGAIQDAEDRRSRKLNQLSKQIEKIEKIVF